MVRLGYLGPVGTYSEEAAQSYAQWHRGEALTLVPVTTIAGCLEALAAGELDLALVPSENSVEGSVNITLDSLWRLDTLHIQYAFIRPIVHAFIAQTTDLAEIEAVYSHPQALGQCQGWLQAYLPQARQCPVTSTAEGLQYVAQSDRVGAIASVRAAQLHHLPIIATEIQDIPDNCTRFWVVSRQQGEGWPQPGDTHTSIAFSLKANAPGALLKVLQLFSDRQINLSRIESRPSKRALGDYLFFVDLEVNGRPDVVADCLVALKEATDVLKVFGSYQFLDLGE
ncbi:prephenate dehydratase [Thermosynechococcus vestitus]|uniref:Prephenate dehydratase n=1 Tax=Thermosynechococcus vestitus (strain NIES-2133 / IAM M-273 / BP-1) TaxID=197221 RepID=Q8DH54_THEVB|nr:prephenate dehydratase [Thermosynechococcus vestitus]BAC09658.1 tlr2106 [Thermosynechococcus vestitus BP-1]BAY52890.1 putative prephenate dehydratase [Thermostichus vulcanus NIES-2134]